MLETNIQWETIVKDVIWLIIDEIKIKFQKQLILKIKKVYKLK